MYIRGKSLSEDLSVWQLFHILNKKVILMKLHGNYEGMREAVLQTLLKYTKIVWQEHIANDWQITATEVCQKVQWKKFRSGWREYMHAAIS